VKAIDSANPLRHPPFLDQVLDRTFNRSTCARCGQESRLEGPMLWTDVAHGLMAWMLPPAQRPMWSMIEPEVIDGLGHPLRQEGPAFVRAWGDRASLRVVFGLDELREKVVASRAGLDDRVVEVLKLPYGDPIEARGPTLERVDDAGPVLVGADRDRPDDEILMPWDDYERAAEVLRDDRHVVGLVDGTWVHWLRAAFPPHEAPEALADD
jgi:hypothetical protein